MTQKQITLPQCELLVVELPEGASEIRIFNDLHRPYIGYRLRHETGRVYFPVDGNWQHLGAVNDVSEEKADTIVARHFMDGCRSYNLYRDYLVSANDGRWLDDSVESLHSLLTANGVVFENPLGKEPDISASAYTDMFTIAKNSRKHLRWEMEQDKVWHKKRTHIFIKQK